MDEGEERRLPAAAATTIPCSRQGYHAPTPVESVVREPPAPAVQCPYRGYQAPEDTSKPASRLEGHGAKSGDCGHHMRLEPRRMLHERDTAAATRIQSHFREYRARARVKPMGGGDALRRPIIVTGPSVESPLMELEGKGSATASPGASAVHLRARVPRRMDRLEVCHFGMRYQGPAHAEQDGRRRSRSSFDAGQARSCPQVPKSAVRMGPATVSKAARKSRVHHELATLVFDKPHPSPFNSPEASVSTLPQRSPCSSRRPSRSTTPPRGRPHSQRPPLELCPLRSPSPSPHSLSKTPRGSTGNSPRPSPCTTPRQTSPCKSPRGANHTPNAGASPPKLRRQLATSDNSDAPANPPSPRASGAAAHAAGGSAQQRHSAPAHAHSPAQATGAGDESALTRHAILKRLPLAQSPKMPPAAPDK